MKILLLLFSLGISSSTQAQVSKLKINDKFTLGEIKGMNGEVYSLDEVQDKVLVLNFWNIGCKGCEQERPYLNKLYQKYKGQDVVFWSVTMNTEESIADHLEDRPIDWDIIGGVDFMNLEGDTTFQIKCMPTNLVLNKNRAVRFFQCGPIIEDQMDADFLREINIALKN